MKQYKFLLTLMLIGCFGFIGDNQVNATSGDLIQNCTVNSTTAAHYKSETNFNTYLKSVGMPTQVAVGAKTLKANRQYAIDRCILVFGGPYDVPVSVQSFKTVNGKTEPRHFGYTSTKKLYSNHTFPADSLAPNADKYIKLKDFEKFPWSNTAVLAKAGGKIPAPISPSDTKAIRAGHLERAVDTFCSDYSSCYSSQGPRGYFDQLNTGLNVVLNSSNLSDYVSIQEYPGDYTTGSFNTYFIDSNNKLWYATHPMVPYKKLFQDGVDLSITNIIVNPSTAFSTKKITSIEITVKNEGIRNIVNTPLRYGYDKMYCQNISLLAGDLKTITITEGQTKCNDSTLTENMYFPNIGTAKERNIQFVATINANKNIPQDEVDFTNNVDQLNVKVINPNASVSVSMSGEKTATVKVLNNTFDTIASNYNGESFLVEVFDTRFSQNSADYQSLGTHSFVYSIASKGNQVFSITLPDKKANGASEYLIKAKIPHYADESTFVDNSAATRLAVQSKITLPSVEGCTEMTTPYTNAMNKLCAGHFPEYPSTKSSEGMQTYHYAMYRLTPQPMPNYDITDVNDSTQTVSLRATQGGTYLMSNGDKTRARMVPRSTSINYKVIFNQPNGAKVVVANGTVKHTLEEGCFSDTEIDLNHRTNCDQLYVFLPNSQSNMFQKPLDFNRTLRIGFGEQAIKETKIPFVNPGMYTFDLQVSEVSQLRKQDYIKVIDQARILPTLSDPVGTPEISHYEWTNPYWGGVANTNYIPPGASYTKDIYHLQYDYEVTGIKGSN
jgi:hypothetical protein